MRIIKFTRVFILIFILFIFLSYGQSSEYIKIAENSNFIMFFNSSNAGIEVKDKKSNKVFRQFPEDWENDFSVGITKFSIPSHLVLEFVDEEGKVTIYNTYALGVMRKNYEIRKIKEGIRLDYNFSTQGVKISIEFTLNPRGISARVPIDSIKEPDNIKLNRIWFLPYFLSASKKDKGYLLIPDGSGAIVRFEESYGNERGFELPLYGYDFGLPFYDMPPKVEGMRLPVFGIKKGDMGILGIIRSGDYDVKIASYIAGNATGYFRIYPIFTYRNLHKFLLYEREASTGQAGEVVDVLVNKISPYALNKDIIVDYYLLSKEKANYSEMAKIFRDYLIKNGMLKKKIDKKVLFNLVLIGGIKIRTTFLGIPTIRFFPLTTFDNAISILEALRKEGITEINLIYKGCQEGGYLSKITNGIKLENKLGGKSGFDKLLNYCSKNGINLFLNAEIVEVHEEGNGFSVARDANRYLNNGLSFLYKWDPVTKKKNRDYDPWFNVLPSKIPYYAKNFVKDLERFGVKGISIENIGDYIYSQNKQPNLLSRSDVASIWKEMLGEISNKYNTIFTHGNLYILPYANLILNIPLDCSNFGIESEPIPFYQMVVHGYIPYSGRPGNLRENQKREFLRMVEYSALPFYTWIYEDSSYFKKSFYNEMLSSNFRAWINQAVKEYKAIKDLYLKIIDAPMKLHEKIGKNVYKVVYENGINVIVNYNTYPVKYKDKVIKGESFVYFHE